MRRCVLVLLACGGLAVCPPRAAGQEKTDDDAVAKELREFRERVFEAYKKRDVDRFLEALHPDVVYTFEDKTVVKGRDGVKEYIKQMTEGPNALVQSMTTEDLTLDGRTIHGPNAAVGWGKTTSRFKLKDGREFTLHSKWTGSAVKEGGRWQVTSIHMSESPFDNDIFRLAMRSVALWVGGGALVGGLVVGGGLTWFSMRRRRTPPGGATGNAP
jgi:ketosteroid isomerase-like protein